MCACLASASVPFMPGGLLLWALMKRTYLLHPFPFRADGNTSRASRRSSSHQQQQQQNTSGAGGSSAAAAVVRNLAAQVSFNHEKRQGWERPVLEDINNRRAGQGMAPVDKLTIQVGQQGCGGRAEVSGLPGLPPDLGIGADRVNPAWLNPACRPVCEL